MSFPEVSHGKVFNEAIRVTMSRAMYSFSQFFPLGFWGVLMRHMHFARSAQGGVLGNLEFTIEFGPVSISRDLTFLE